MGGQFVFVFFPKSTTFVTTRRGAKLVILNILFSISVAFVLITALLAILVILVILFLISVAFALRAAAAT